MTITTKFEIGDEVVAIVDNKIVKTIVTGIDIKNINVLSQFKNEEIIYTVAALEKSYQFRMGFMDGYPARKLGTELWSKAEFRIYVQGLI